MKIFIHDLYYSFYQRNKVNYTQKKQALGLIILQLVLAMFLVLISYNAKAQTRLVLGDSVFLKMNGNAFIVVDNKNANAIDTADIGGHIISESEKNKIRWVIKDTTGTYKLPFAKIVGGSVKKIPVTLKIDTAGTGANGRIDFSTYSTPSNNTPFPSTVISLNHNGANNSLFTLDRFWIIDANNYTSKPDVDITLSYLPAEHAAPNTITESNLKAQRFNTTTNNWEAKLFGTTNAAADSCVNIKVEAADFFAAWALVDKSSPLPVTLTSFTAACENNNATLNWVTSSEINNDYFSVEKSSDGINFYEITQVTGNGNSNQIINYKHIDMESAGGAYYRLKQVDFNGNYEYFKTVFAGCKGAFSDFNVFPNPSEGVFNITFEEKQKSVIVYVSNLLGEIIFKELVNGVQTTKIDLSQYKKGVYHLTIIRSGEKQTKKLVKF